MQVTAKVDYALRAMVELAAADGRRMSRDELAAAQDIPPRYLEAILASLRQSGLLLSARGAAGGYSLAAPAEAITVADVSRAVDGPLALVQGRRPEHVDYDGASETIGALWVGLRAAIREVMENVTVADLVAGELPPPVRALLANKDAWVGR